MSLAPQLSGILCGLLGKTVNIGSGHNVGCVSPSAVSDLVQGYGVLVKGVQPFFAGIEQQSMLINCREKYKASLPKL